MCDSNESTEDLPDYDELVSESTDSEEVRRMMDTEEPLIIEGINISDLSEDDLVGAKEIEEMVDAADLPDHDKEKILSDIPDKDKLDDIMDTE